MKKEGSPWYLKPSLISFEGDMNFLGLGTTFNNSITWNTKEALLCMLLFYISIAVLFTYDMTKLGSFISLQDEPAVPIDESF